MWDSSAEETLIVSANDNNVPRDFSSFARPMHFHSRRRLGDISVLQTPSPCFQALKAKLGSSKNSLQGQKTLCLDRIQMICMSKKVPQREIGFLYSVIIYSARETHRVKLLQVKWSEAQSLDSVKEAR